MKKLSVSMLLLISANALAGNGNFYLGGSTDLQSCANAAGAAGYALGVYGAGFDDNGVYYPYFNACFGKGIKTSYQLPYIPVPAPTPDQPPSQLNPTTGPITPPNVITRPRPETGKAITLPVTMDADSVSAVLMNGMADHASSGNTSMVQPGPNGNGYVMQQGGLKIHCFSGSFGETGISLPVQSQGCKITRSGGNRTVNLPITMDADSVSAVLMNGMSKHVSNGNTSVVLPGPNGNGYVMQQGGLKIHCFSGSFGEGGTSLAVQSQGCNITIK